MAKSEVEELVSASLNSGGDGTASLFVNEFGRTYSQSEANLLHDDYVKLLKRALRLELGLIDCFNEMCDNDIARNIREDFQSEHREACSILSALILRNNAEPVDKAGLSNYIQHSLIQIASSVSPWVRKQTLMNSLLMNEKKLYHCLEQAIDIAPKYDLCTLRPLRNRALRRIDLLRREN